jgi:hypothetical protein
MLLELKVDMSSIHLDDDKTSLPIRCVCKIDVRRQEWRLARRFWIAAWQPAR